MKRLKNKKTLNQQEVIKSTHSFFLFDFDAKRNKRTGGAEEKKKNTIPAEGLCEVQTYAGRKSAFTLAETLITLTILGIVAAITIPALINRQQEAANRTKVKKAMTMYEKALNQMIIENDIKGNVGTELNDETCSKTTEYFKKVERDNCRFKTADRVWWDITDIEHTVIMLNDKYKDTELSELRNLAKDKDNRDVFEMVGGIKDGIVRINDKSAVSGDDAEYLTKLWEFINSTSNSGANGTLGYDFPYQKMIDDYMLYKDIECPNPQYHWDSGWLCTNCFGCTHKVNSYSVTTYDLDGKIIMEGSNTIGIYGLKDNNSNSKVDIISRDGGNTWQYHISDYDDKDRLTYLRACDDGQGTTCNDSGSTRTTYNDFEDGVTEEISIYNGNFSYGYITAPRESDPDIRDQVADLSNCENSACSKCSDRNSTSTGVCEKAGYKTCQMEFDENYGSDRWTCTK